MKKLISLSAVIMLSFMAFAQDTIPKNSNPNPNNNLDTMTRHNNNFQKDTANKNWNKPHHTDSTNSSTSTNTMSSDSMNTTNSANSTPATSGTNTMTNDSSTMTNSNHTMDNTGKTSGNQSSTSNTTTVTTKTNSEDSIKAYEKTLTDRVMMKDDKMYMLKDGEATLLEKSYKLSSGAVVSTLGTVKYPGGRVINLKNGQFIELKPATTETSAKKVDKTKKSTKSVVIKKKVKTQSN